MNTSATPEPSAPDAAREVMLDLSELTVTAVAGGYEVRMGPRGRAVVDRLADIEAVVADPSRWLPPPRRPGYERRGVLVKASPELDLYGEWSSVADGFGMVGTAQDFLDDGLPWVRVERARVYGTSVAVYTDLPASFPVPWREHGWDANGFVLNNLPGPRNAGWLPRVRVGDYLTALAAGDTDTALACVQDIPDED